MWMFSKQEVIRLDEKPGACSDLDRNRRNTDRFHTESLIDITGIRSQPIREEYSTNILTEVLNWPMADDLLETAHRQAEQAKVVELLGWIYVLASNSRAAEVLDE